MTIKRFWQGLCAFSSSWSGTIIIVLFIIFFIAQGFIIPTRSMVGTFFEGDLLFVKKFSYGIPTPRIPWINTPILPDFNHNGHLFEGERPKRGEIVVFIPPKDDRTYFVKRVFGVGGDEVIFSEVSPRPHDTGMVTLISQDLSEFALHVRAFLGLPVGGIRQYGPAASAVILPQLTSQNVSFDNVQNAVGADLQIRLFGKPEIDGSRRLGVALATAESVVDAIERAKHAAGQVKVQG